jgi:hypothetical protein
MYSTPCATWMGGFETAWADEKAPRIAVPPSTKAASGRRKRVGFIAVLSSILRDVKSVEDFA